MPSEYSLVSDTSSLEGGEEKILSEATVRPLIVNISKPSSPDIREEITKPSLSPESVQEVGRLSKAYVIASELLNTEKHYVAILHLIDQVGTKYLLYCLLTRCSGSMSADPLA